MKTYTVAQVAGALGVERQTVYHWLRRGWIKAKLDYRGRRVFTEEDLQQIKRWRNTLRDT